MSEAKPHYSRFNTAVMTLASTRWGSWFLSYSLRPLDRLFLRLSNGQMSLTHLLSGLPMVILTTTGARSGLPRTLPLAYIRDLHNPQQFAVIASNWGHRHHPAWSYNLKAHPKAAGSIDGQVKNYVSHEAQGEEYAWFWQLASETYRGFLLYKQRAGKRHIPIMVLVQE